MIKKNTKLSKENLGKLRRMMEEGVEPSSAYKYMKTPAKKREFAEPLKMVDEIDIRKKGKQATWKKEIDQSLR